MITGIGIPKIQSSKPLPMVRLPALGLKNAAKRQHRKCSRALQRNLELLEERFFHCTFRNRFLTAASHRKQEGRTISSGDYNQEPVLLTPKMVRIRSL
jgi:hypothetical protein